MATVQVQRLPVPDMASCMSPWSRNEENGCLQVIKGPQVGRVEQGVRRANGADMEPSSGLARLGDLLRLSPATRWSSTRTC